MQQDVWALCNGVSQISLLQEKAWRIVESQEVTATRKLVDSLAEQIILEEMLESNKPTFPEEYASYHPLLYTPFRYPPLKYGSRFGKRIEPALWYGSVELGTAMAEKAYYKLNFLRASEADYSNFVEEGITAFAVQIKTKHGINLLENPFKKYNKQISSPVTYEVSQLLGSRMREERVLAFLFQSARCKNSGANIGLFTPQAFLHKVPIADSFQSWQCIANQHSVEFVRSSSPWAESKSYILENFLVNDGLPFPAS